MNRKWRMSCNGVQNIERDFFKFVMIDDPLISRFISIHPGIIYRLQISDNTFYSLVDLPQIRNSILLVLSVNYVSASEWNPRCHLLLARSFSFLKQQFPGVEFREKLNRGHWLLLSQVKICPACCAIVNKTNLDFPLFFLLFNKLLIYVDIRQHTLCQNFLRGCYSFI